MSIKRSREPCGVGIAAQQLQPINGGTGLTYVGPQGSMLISDGVQWVYTTQSLNTAAGRNAYGTNQEITIISPAVTSTNSIHVTAEGGSEVMYISSRIAGTSFNVKRDTVT